MRGRALGGAAHDPAHRQDEQATDDQDEQNEESVTPGQVAQKAQMVAGIVHNVPSDWSLPALSWSQDFVDEVLTQGGYGAFTVAEMLIAFAFVLTRRPFRVE